MEEIRRIFEDQTGLKALTVTQIGIGVYMVKAEDGNTYMVV